jgi:nitroimidazol reductase NimA-like FMN-containing flavoprotein (pyridoxamine 5'-phosphate oxidase superfamily)
MRKSDREITDIIEIESIIKESDVCRIALADGNIPYIVTMNFGYSGGKEKYLFFHCAKEGRKLDMIRKNNYACFEMDTGHGLKAGTQACDFSMAYSSVVGYGFISFVSDEKEKLNCLMQIMAHYTDRKDLTFRTDSISRTTVLRLEIKEMTGKRS